MKFSDVVKLASVKKDVKPAELARRTGYSAQHISDLLSGTRRWNEDSINKVCSALGIKIQYDYDRIDEAEESMI